MRRSLPVAITGLVGITMLIDYFVNAKPINTFAATLRAWGVIVATCSLGIGAVNLLMVHTKRIRHDVKARVPSGALVGSLILTALAGLIGGQTSAGFTFAYEAVIQPVNNAVFSLLAFYIVSASYRAFRLRNIEATVLLVVGVIVLIGNAPVGQAVLPAFASANTWIMNYLNVAGQRGIMVTAGIAFIGLSLRVILGIERNYLGSSGD